jgi:hypothetical protein
VATDCPRAGIARISGPLRTAAIEAFKQPHERDERRRAAQHDNLVTRLEHLDGVEVAGLLATIDMECRGWTRP